MLKIQSRIPFSPILKDPQLFNVILVSPAKEYKTNKLLLGRACRWFRKKLAPREQIPFDPQGLFERIINYIHEKHFFLSPSEFPDFLHLVIFYKITLLNSFCEDFFYFKLDNHLQLFYTTQFAEKQIFDFFLDTNLKFVTSLINSGIFFDINYLKPEHLVSLFPLLTISLNEKMNLIQKYYEKNGNYPQLSQLIPWDQEIPKELYFSKYYDWVDLKVQRELLSSKLSRRRLGITNLREIHSVLNQNPSIQSIDERLIKISKGADTTADHPLFQLILNPSHALNLFSFRLRFASTSNPLKSPHLKNYFCANNISNSDGYFLSIDFDPFVSIVFHEDSIYSLSEVWVSCEVKNKHNMSHGVPSILVFVGSCNKNTVFTYIFDYQNHPLENNFKIFKLPKLELINMLKICLPPQDNPHAIRVLRISQVELKGTFVP